jgi:dephospho-CoA kinase
MQVERARPRQAGEIAAFINQYNHGRRALTRDDIMEAFGEKAFMLLKLDGQLVGLVGWQVENLVARTDEVTIDPRLPLGQAVKVLMEEVERASRELQCEIALLFLPKNLAGQEVVWHGLGYQVRTVQTLTVRAWQEAAEESLPGEDIMLFKQLRKDRVLRPV